MILYSSGMVKSGPGVKISFFVISLTSLFFSVLSVSTPYFNNKLFAYAQPSTSELCTDPHEIIGQCVPINLQRVGANKSPALSGDGKGDVDVDIAILGTGGVLKHNDLNLYKCITIKELFQDRPGFGMETSCDGTEHDTGVAGVAAARDNNFGVVGIAPGARIWSIKACCTNKILVDGLNYVADHSNEIEVLNLSWGYNLMGASREKLHVSQVITEKISKLIDKGVIVVLSAGNYNIDASDHFPLNVDAITVSAITDTDGKCGGSGPDFEVDNNFYEYRIPHQTIVPVINHDDFVASYSDYGYLVDIAASGTNVISTSSNNGYDYFTGTSFAAPAVAGAAALYKSYHPNATPSSVIKYLEDTATKTLDSCDGKARGYFKDKYSAELNVRNNPSTLYSGGYPHREPLLYMGWPPFVK